MVPRCADIIRTISRTTANGCDPGVPFNDSTNWRLQIAELGEAVLGDNLLGFQAGNEPDLYGSYVLLSIRAFSFL